MNCADNRHAYLIIAHNNFYTLSLLLKLLDHERNDIYLHIGKQVKNAPFKELKGCVKRSRLVFTKRIAVKWGRASQVDCELLLLKTAMKNGPYDFVHLISGVDLPIKPASEILRFFDANRGRLFLQVGNAKNHFWRVSKFNFLVGRKDDLLKRAVDFFAYALNEKLKINRLKKYGQIKIVKTSNWFSITGECAEYILSRRRFIKKLTRFSCCADEMFLGTVIYDSPFWEGVYKKEFSWDGHMRYIDRIRNVGASPHTFTIADRELLDSSEMLFARKFDEKVDSDIIEYIFNKYSEQGE